MRPLKGLAALLVAGLLVGAPSAGAADPADLTPPANFSVAKFEGGVWQRLLAIPAAQSPFFGANAGNCQAFQSRKLWIIGWNAGPSDVDCRIPAGTPLFVWGPGTECSTLEAFPFHGETDAELAECARRHVKRHLQSTAIFIDGQQVRSLSRFLVESPPFDFRVPADNLLFVPGPATGRAVSYGYAMFVNPLPPGEHTIRLLGRFIDPLFPFDTTYHITVG